MNKRLRKIGHVKAKDFNKSFDSIYDLWKEKARTGHNYGGQLRFIKEHHMVFIYIELEDLEPNQLVDPKNFNRDDTTL